MKKVKTLALALALVLCTGMFGGMSVFADDPKADGIYVGDTFYDDDLRAAFDAVKAAGGGTIEVYGVVEVDAGSASMQAPNASIALVGKTDDATLAAAETTASANHFAWFHSQTDITIKDLTFDARGRVNYALRVHKAIGTIENVTATNAIRTAVDLNLQYENSGVDYKLTLKNVSAENSAVGFGASAVDDGYLTFENCRTVNNDASILIHNEQGSVSVDLSGISVNDKNNELIVQYRDPSTAHVGEGSQVIAVTGTPAEIGSAAQWTGVDVDSDEKAQRGSMVYSKAAGTQDGYRVTLPDNTVLYFASEEEMSEALGLMLTNGLLTADEYDAVLLTAEAYEVPVESETTTEAENEEDDETTTTEDEEETTTALDTQKLGTSVSNPKTGDASAAMWIVMAGAAVCAMVLLRRKPVAE